MGPYFTKQFCMQLLQMHLMALADTVASCKMNLCDRFVIDAAKAANSKDNAAATTGGEPTAGKVTF